MALAQHKPPGGLCKRAGPLQGHIGYVPHPAYLLVQLLVCDRNIVYKPQDIYLRLPSDR